MSPSGASGSGGFGSVAASSAALGLDLLELGLELLDPARDLAHPRDRLLGVAALALGGADRVGGGVALGPQALDLGQQLAAAGVELEQPVEVLGGAHPRERGARRPRVLADAPQVEQGCPLVRRSPSRRRRRPPA